jgi:hypothetical protein
MDDGRPLRERVDALERAVTDGHADDGLPEAARLSARVDDVEATVEELDDRLAELEAAVQALRGFAGGVRAIDDAVERRANAAIARVDRLEAELARADAADEEPDRAGDGGADTRARRDGAAEDADSHGEAAGEPDDIADGVRDGTLRETVAERSDAALAEAAARRDRSGDESDAERSLADRLRRLL